MANKLAKMPSAHGHTAGIFADMSVDGPQIGTLVVIFDRAKNLPNRKTIGKQNPYVAARLGKEAKKTETDLRGGQTPRWDQELRYTVHESPDYLQFKVSVFNDDKKTDLIGETWIDLSAVIIPGGGQSDSWHELKFKNKYAGDIRMEMTYYDSRPEDEAVIERRTVVTEKSQTKNTNNPTSTGSSSLSGPRQPRPIKRRPLPNNPTGASPSPSAPVAPPVAPAQDYPAPAPATAHHPARPGPDHVPAPAPLSSHRQTDARPSSRHTEMPLPRSSPINHYEYDAPEGSIMEPPDQRGEPYSAQPRPQPADNYESFHRESHRQINHPAPESHAGTYDPNNYHGRGSYEAIEPYGQYQGQQHIDDSRYSAEPTPYLPERRTSQMPPQEYAMISQASPLPTEEGNHYRYNMAPTQQDPRRQSPLRQLIAPGDDRPTYAAMQPTVEDEGDDMLPPPPPVHRTSVSTAMSHPAAGAPSYKPYSPQEYTPQHTEYRDMQRHAPVSPIAMAPADQDLAIAMPKPSQGPPRSFITEPSNPPVPPSLAAGYNVANEPIDNGQSAALERRYSRVPASIPMPAAANYVQNVPVPQTSAVQPLRSSPAPIMDNNVQSRSRSISPNPRPLSYRKSISPRPPSRDEREAPSIPFSPDSFDTFNPRRSPSATRESRSRYATPDREAPPNQASKAEVDDGPIIGDDGRVIDPSDHLPSETWAPEPEKKTKKPEVVIRFKHNPQNASFSARSSPREQQQHRSVPTTPDSGVRATFRPRSAYVAQPPRQSYERHQSPGTMVATYTPPRPGSSARDQDPYSQAYHPSTSTTYSTPPRHRSISPNPQIHPSTPTTYSTPPRRRSISPNPQMQSSPLYSYESSGPPIPAKVPIAAPVSNGYPGPGMDALSQELQSIDIGPGGYDTGRAVRRYAPRVPVSSGGGYR